MCCPADKETRKEIWKGAQRWAPAPPAMVKDQAGLPRNMMEAYPSISVPPESGLQTSVMAVEPETAQGVGSIPSQPWYKASLAHSGTHPVTRPSQELGQSHTHHAHGNRLTD